MSFPKRVQVGTDFTVFPAASFNALVDDYYLRRAGKPTKKQSRSASSTGQSLVVVVKNTSGTDLGPGAVLGISSILYSYADDNSQVYRGPMVIGVTPASPAYDNKFCVLKDYIPNNGIGPAWIVGCDWARVDITDAGHTFAAIKDGETASLQSAASGLAQIIYKEKQAAGDPTGVQWSLILLAGGGQGGSSSVDIKIVLIDKDISGVVEDDPADTIEDLDIDLTEDEITAGYTIVFQDPPDDDFDANNVDTLNRWGYKRTKVTDAKYYETQSFDGTSQSIPAADKIRLQLNASNVANFFQGDTITLTSGLASGESRIITAFDETTQDATVDSAWSVTPDAASDYTITSTRDRELALTIIDDPDHVPPRKIVRYATTEFYYDDGEPFQIGAYDQQDYPDFPENETWPPSWIDDPDTFFAKRYRGVVIDGVFITRLCEQLPPPELPPQP